MKRRIALWGAVAFVLSLALLCGSHRSPTVAAPAGGRMPVLVELFTSEGCSSCPPADAVLSDLERTQPVPGAEVIALGLHVDYWNSGSWADRFSSHAFTVRQNDYAAHFHNDSAYTPQMIVDGQTEFVGSDRDRAVQAIARAARSPKAVVQVTAGTASSGAATLQVRVEHLPTLPRGDRALVYLALTEDGLQSAVRGGENDGRVLRHSAVVRQMRLLGEIKNGETFTSEPMVTLDRGWNRARTQAIVFVQTDMGRRVVGVGVTPLG